MAVALQVVDQQLALAGIGPGIEFQGRPSEYFLWLIAGEAAEAGVDLEETAGCALADADGIGRGMEGLGKFLLAVLEQALGIFAVGHVAEGRDDA